MPEGTSARLHGRVAIITGASSGLGRAIAYLFATEGAKCFLVDKYLNPRNSVNATTGKADDWNNRLLDTKTSSASANEAQTENNASARIKVARESTFDILQSMVGSDYVALHQADLTEEPSVEGAIQACVARFSRLDILINSHGISVESTHAAPLRCHETTISDFLLTQSINTTSLFLTCKYALAQFISPSQTQIYDGGRGWIVNIASVQGLTPYYATPSYCASKGAAVMLTRQIALDYARDGVRCNAVCPGFLATDMTRNLQGDAEKLKSVAERQPLNVGMPARYDEGALQGGLGNVEDIARMVLVLASDDARWMTGQPVVVDGAYSLS